MENIELSDCIYEHIKDTFYYGVFGDFKLVIDKKTGYFNATKLCVSGGKEYKLWARLERSKNMINYIQKNRGADMHPYYEIKGANKDKTERQFTGTYVPKELILDIASWVSVEFYFRCNSIIINYFVNEFKKMDKNDLQNKIKEVEEKMEKLTLEKDAVVVENSELKEIMLRLEKAREEDQKIMLRQEEYMRSLGITLEEVRDQNDTLIDKTKGLKKQNRDIQRKLGIAVEDRAPLPEDKSKCERFVLLKLNDPEYPPYYTMRAQDSYVNRRLKTRRLNFPQMEVLLDLKAHPNSKTLYNRIKAELKAKGVTFEGNSIDLLGSEVTQKELVDEMKVINDQKYLV